LFELEQKLPRDLRVGQGALVLNDKAFLRQLLSDVRQTLLPQASAADTGEGPG
jgi:hypothetical protein